MAHKTASTHGSAFVRGSHRFHIVGYRQRRALASVSVGKSSAVRSGDFEAGGHTWALKCRFGTQGLASISLQLVSGVPVTVMASLRIDDPFRRWPAAVWRSDDAKFFPALGVTSEGWIWELRVPEAFRDHEERYVEDDDRLAILCVVDVLCERPTCAYPQTKNRFISAVPPPTLARDFLRLLFPHKSKSTTKSEAEPVPRFRPDVTFVVEEIEIQAHKLVLAMQSPVLAAGFRWNKDETRSSSIIRVHDMSATTFRAMLRFIYTGELPIKLKRKDWRIRFVAMALDLLVAADRYDLERLRTMCGNVLVECMDAVSVIPILMAVHGRHSCQQLKDSCIDYIASHPDAYTAMKATEEYKELKESCCSFLLDITDKVAINMARKLRSFPSSSSISHQPSSTAVHHGTHVFTIPNFRAVRRSLSGDDGICSGKFQIGGYDWIIRVHISKSLEEQEKLEPMLLLQLFSDPGTTHVTTSVSFKLDYPSVTPPIGQVTKTFTEKFEFSYTKFMVMKSAMSANDDPLTIHCQLTVTREAYAATGDKIGMPPPNITTLLENLLMSERGSDVRFLVEECDFHAHGLVLAARSPALYEIVTMAANQDKHIVQVDEMKAEVFRSVLHFIYTDKLPSMDNLLLDAKDMLAAACRFRLNRMRIACENFLADDISKENVFNTLKLAQRYHCLKLKDYCLEFISLPHVTKHVLKTIISFD